MVAFQLAKIVHHVVFEERVDVVGTYLAEACAIDSLKGGPGLEAMLLGELLPLLLHDVFVFADSHQ